MAVQQVSITIRSSNGVDDYSLSCNVEWSIRQLKEVIQDVHPLKPETSVQKLFYRGVELQSNQVIHSFLKVSDDLHVIELVLTTGTTTAADQANTGLMESTGLRHRNVGGTPPPPNNPWLQWQQNQMSAGYQHYSYPQMPANNENYAAMWQQYQQQVSDYLNYYNALAQTQTSVQGQSSSSVSQTDGANPPAAAPADPPQGNPPEANPPMNAQGGFVADNDDLVANDCYQTGIFQAQRRPPHPDEVERRDNAGQEGSENTDDNNNDNADNENGENETEEQEVPPPPSIFATAWCFITTFFTSLIPQPPPVV